MSEHSDEIIRSLTLAINRLSAVTERDAALGERLVRIEGKIERNAEKIQELQQQHDRDTLDFISKLTETNNTHKKVVIEQHEPIIIWARNFMDSYRKILTAVIASGIITGLGLLIQAYYLLQKSR